jgi:hypothetical protein
MFSLSARRKPYTAIWGGGGQDISIESGGGTTRTRTQTGRMNDKNTPTRRERDKPRWGNSAVAAPFPVLSVRRRRDYANCARWENT